MRFVENWSSKDRSCVSCFCRRLDLLIVLIRVHLQKALFPRHNAQLDPINNIAPNHRVNPACFVVQFWNQVRRADGSRIPPHLSLPAFQHSALSLSREHQAPGYIENREKQRRDLYRQMDAEDPLLAERKALPSRGAAPQRWKRFPAHAYQNSAQSGIHGVGHPARYQIESQGLRVFADQAGKDDHRATPGYVPLGQAIPQGCQRRRALGTSLFPIASITRAVASLGPRCRAPKNVQKNEMFRKTQQSTEGKNTKWQRTKEK
jgi:hypothetical protein